MHRIALCFLSSCLVVLPSGCAHAPGMVQFAPPSHLIRAAIPNPLALRVAKRVTKRRGNTMGKVMILEYHRVVAKDSRYDRSTKKFRQDLQILYEWGFRPVTLSQYLDNKIDIPPGATPVVFTFDDSDPSQFTLLPGGSIDPTCAVGIWQSFAEKYPDFPIRATFYVLPNGPFGQKQFRDRKVELLKEWGCEVGSHAWTHHDLRKMTDDQVASEFGRSVEFIRKLGFEPRHLALPYGSSPRNEALTRDFTWRGKKYHFDSVVLAGSAPARAPTDPKLNPYRLPRVQGVDIDYGFKFWIEKERKMKVALYVQP